MPGIKCKVIVHRSIAIDETVRRVMEGRVSVPIGAILSAVGLLLLGNNQGRYNYTKCQSYSDGNSDQPSHHSRPKNNSYDICLDHYLRIIKSYMKNKGLRK